MVLENIAISLRIRNEAPFLDEWFQYYIALGFTNFIVKNDPNPELPDDGTLELLTFWKTKLPGLEVDNIETNSFESHIYHKGTSVLERNEFRYILIIDIDEFLVLAEGFDLNKYLDRMWNSNVGCIRINRLNAIDPVDFFLEKKKGYETLQPTHLSYSDYYHPTHKVARPGSSDGFKSFCSPKASTWAGPHECGLIPTFTYCDPGFDEMFIIHTQMRGQISKCIYTNKKYNRDKGWANGYRVNDFNCENYMRKSVNYYKDNQITKPLIDRLHLFSCKLFKKFFDSYGFLIIRNSNYDTSIQKLGLLENVDIKSNVLNKVIIGGDTEANFSINDILVTKKK